MAKPLAITFDMIEPPGRTVALKTKDLQTLIMKVEDLRPYFYNGRKYQLVHKRIGPGIYRAWLEREV